MFSRPAFRFGTARRNPDGSLARGEFNNRSGQPMQSVPGIPGTPHDWTGFDNAFPRSTPVQLLSSVSPGVKPMQPQGTVIGQDVAPTPTQKLADGSTALRIDPRYATLGQSPIARATAPQAEGGGLLGNDIQKQIVAAYPQVGVAGSRENQAFIQAFHKAHADRFAATGQATPWNADDALGIAHSLFRPNPSVAGSPAANTNPGDPLYKSPVTGADIKTPVVAGAQAPVNFAGSDVGAIPRPNIQGGTPIASNPGSVIQSGVINAAKAVGDFLTPSIFKAQPGAPTPAPAPSLVSTDVNLPAFQWSKPSPTASAPIGATASDLFAGKAPMQPPVPPNPLDEKKPAFAGF